MFSWPLYSRIDKSANDLFTALNNTQANKSKVKDLNKRKLLGVQDYLEDFTDIISLDSFENASEKFILAESAKVT